jgi:hypothetical protein
MGQHVQGNIRYPTAGILYGRCLGTLKRTCLEMDRHFGCYLSIPPSERMGIVSEVLDALATFLARSTK